MGKASILHLINTFSVGGAEMHLLSLVGAVDRSRYDVAVAFFKEEAQEARSLVPDFEALGIEVIDLGLRHSLAVRPVVRLRRLLAERGFDVLHTHLFRADVFGALAGSLARVPAIVSTVHNEEQFLRRPVHRFLQRAAATRAGRVIAISDAVRRFLVDVVGIPGSKIVRIHYGIGPNGALPGRAKIRAELGIPEDAPLVGTVGRLAPQKGHRYLVEAFALVRERVPQACLLIVGHDEGGLRGYLEALAADLGVSESVRFAGFHPDARAVISAMDVFALPSLWEGFGLVLLEAMSAACPVVATAVGAIPEIVVPGETGLLAEPGDSASLARPLAELLMNLEKARATGEAGRRRCEEHFGLERMVSETQAVYESLGIG